MQWGSSTSCVSLPAWPDFSLASSRTITLCSCLSAIKVFEVWLSCLKLLFLYRPTSGLCKKLYYFCLKISVCTIVLIYSNTISLLQFNNWLFSLIVITCFFYVNKVVKYLAWYVLKKPRTIDMYRFLTCYIEHKTFKTIYQYYLNGLNNQFFL